MRNTEPMSLLSLQGLSPERIACDLAIDLGDKNPIRPAVKRRAHPFGIDFRGRAGRHLSIYIVSAEVVGERFFAYCHEFEQVARVRAANHQLSVSSETVNFFDWRTGKIENEVQ